MNALIERLASIAAYEGPWQPLRAEREQLHQRTAELRRREQRLDGLLVIALVGGSGVGKSTLLNALAGDLLAKTSEFRPCTELPTVYHPPGAQMEFTGWHCVSGSALEHLVIIDTPDSDTIVKEHRAIVEKALAQCDLILICGSPEKYLDEATWSLLRPLRHERTMVCVETKAHEESAGVREHWLRRLNDEGFEIDAYFRISARRTLDRKLTGVQAGEEFDFPALELYLRERLSREHVQRIKRSNAVGLLTKTIETLDTRLGSHAASLEALEKTLDAASSEIVRETLDVLRDRLFAESHLWRFAIGQEIALRAKGVMGTLFRAVESLRTLPARVASRLSWFGGRGLGHQAAAMLGDRDVMVEDSAIVMDAVQSAYRAKETALNVELAQAGFEASTIPDGLPEFESDVQARLSEVLRGPARDRLVARARALTCWPLTLLADAPSLAFIGYAGYAIVRDYFQSEALPANYFLHTLIVLAILLGLELIVISILARTLAWSARAAALRDLRQAFAMRPAAFNPERNAVSEALQRVRQVQNLHAQLRSISGEYT